MQPETSGSTAFPTNKNRPAESYRQRVKSGTRSAHTAAWISPQACTPSKKSLQHCCLRFASIFPGRMWNANGENEAARLSSKRRWRMHEFSKKMNDNSPVIFRSAFMIIKPVKFSEISDCSSALQLCHQEVGKNSAPNIWQT